LLELALDTTRR